ncbi:MAG: hypothetical protein ACLVGL_06560 [Waltera sp.]
MTMTEKKHAIKPYPLGAHVEDGAIRFAYASGKKDCGIIIYDRKSGKKTHRVPFRQEERMGNVYCKYLELDAEHDRVSSSMKGVRIAGSRMRRGSCVSLLMTENA